MESRNFVPRCPKHVGSNRPSVNLSPLPELPSHSLNSRRTSCSSQKSKDMEYEIRRLKIELKQTMDMYHASSKETLTANQKVIELEKWKMKEGKRLKESQLSEERDKAKYKATIEAAEASQKTIKSEVQKRVNAEMKARKEADEKTKLLAELWQSHIVLKYQSLFHGCFAFVLFLFCCASKEVLIR